MSTIKELIERVEKAVGADESLDADILWFLGDWNNLGGFWREHKVTGERERFQYTTAPAYTASVDDVIALIGEKMPGATWEVAGGVTNTETGARVPEARIYPNEDGCGYITGYAPTPALALLLAFLRAWEARDA